MTTEKSPWKLYLSFTLEYFQSFFTTYPTITVTFINKSPVGGRKFFKAKFIRLARVQKKRWATTSELILSVVPPAFVGGHVLVTHYEETPGVPEREPHYAFVRNGVEKKWYPISVEVENREVVSQISMA